MENITIQNIIDATCGRLVSGDRAWNINAVSTNTKEIPELTGNGCAVLFIPIVGERVDAHQFLYALPKDGSKERGTAACMASSSFLSSEKGQEFTRSLIPPSPDNDRFTVIEVDDTLIAFQQLAAWYRSLFKLPVIGITGSVGKTTTKEMVAAALQASLCIHKTAGNQNSQVGLPLTIFGLEHVHQAAVIEMGMSEFGEMSRIADVAKPGYAILTNIGVAHIGNLGSQENIRTEKLHITDHFHNDSLLLLNADDDLLKEDFGKGRYDVLWYGFDERADFSARNVSVQGDGLDFMLHYPGNLQEPIHLKVLGKHNIRNALAALAIAWKLGISPAVAKLGLEACRPIDMRGNLVSVNGLRILDDSYNASPDSMKSAVEVLCSLPGLTRRIVVFADILELGSQTISLHEEVGAFLARRNEAHPDKIDCLICIGHESRHIMEGFHASEARITGSSDVTCRHFLANEDAIQYLKQYLRTGDGVLVKGSRGMHTEAVVSALKEFHNP